MIFRAATKTNKVSPNFRSPYEALAYEYLVQQGLVLIESNFTSRFGEIDLIMQDKSSVVFIEVKFRSYQDYGSGLESITYRKQRKLLTTARYFLHRQPDRQQQPSRFDAIAIKPLIPHPKNCLNEYKVDWIQHAFDLGDGFSSL